MSDFELIEGSERKSRRKTLSLVKGGKSVLNAVCYKNVTALSSEVNYQASGSPSVTIRSVSSGQGMTLTEFGFRMPGGYFSQCKPGI